MTETTLAGVPVASPEMRELVATGRALWRYVERLLVLQQHLALLRTSPTSPEELVAVLSNLADANLRGADLRWANLRYITLRGARCSAGTRWPEGFVPEGVVMVSEGGAA